MFYWQLKTLESSLDDKKRELDLVLSEKENVEAQRDDLNNRLQAVLTLLGAAANGGQQVSFNPVVLAFLQASKTDVE